MKRLDGIFNLIDSRIGVIDVGTDHGLLPIRLALSGYAGNLIASDINNAPLKSARENCRLSGLPEGRIRFSLSDGLDDCDPSRVDTVVIAGMGGDQICAILDRAEWTMNRRYQLVLQPMTKAEILRFWLCNNGYCIESEQIASENGRLFRLLSVRFQDRNTPLSDAELFCGRFDQIRSDRNAEEAIRLERSRITKKLAGLENRRDMGAALSFYSAICQQMDDFLTKLNQEEAF